MVERVAEDFVTGRVSCDGQRLQDGDARGDQGSESSTRSGDCRFGDDLPDDRYFERDAVDDVRTGPVLSDDLEHQPCLRTGMDH